MTNENKVFYLSDRMSAMTRAGGSAGQGMPPGGDGGGSGMEPRIAKLEAHVEHIDKSITRIETDLREMRTQARHDFRLLFGALITVALGLAGMMAAGFGWL